MDEYVEVSNAPGCFTRLKDSIAKVGIGLLIIVISFPLLFWNEGRAIKRAKDLEFGRDSVVKIDANSPKGNDGALVYVSGKTSTETGVTDSDFSISADALTLERTVEMFQWKEHKKTTKKGDQNVTTYRYEEVWSESKIGSDSFKKPGYDNPPFPRAESAVFQAKNAKVGALKIDPKLLEQWPSETARPVVDAEISKNFKTIGGKSPTLDQGSAYFGNPGSPSVGDVRISYNIGPVGDGSFVAGITSGTLTPFVHDDLNGTIALVSAGVKSSDEMFQSAEDANTLLTWGLRLLGFILMFVGFNLLFGPFDTIIRMIPIIGAIIDFGTTLIAGLLAIVLTFITIAIGWIFYRPLIGILLLAVAGLGAAAIIALAVKAKKKA